MRFGLSLEEALRRAAEDLHALADPYRGEVNIVGIDRDGRHAAVSTAPGKMYLMMDGDMDKPAELEREFVPAPLGDPAPGS
jgi:hypothetical protein